MDFPDLFAAEKKGILGQVKIQEHFFVENPVLSITEHQNTKGSQALDCGGGTECLTASPQRADPV